MHNYLEIKTANKIFEKGIQLNYEKVFSQLGFEITINIVIPFCTLKNTVNKIRDWNILKEKDVKTIDDNLRQDIFKVSCPYWEQNKGDIWEAFEKRQKRNV